MKATQNFFERVAVLLFVTCVMFALAYLYTLKLGWWFGLIVPGISLTMCLVLSADSASGAAIGGIGGLILNGAFCVLIQFKFVEWYWPALVTTVLLISVPLLTSPSRTLRGLGMLLEESRQRKAKRDRAAADARMRREWEEEAPIRAERERKARKLEQKAKEEVKRKQREAERKMQEQREAELQAREARTREQRTRLDAILAERSDQDNRLHIHNHFPPNSFTKATYEYLSYAHLAADDAKRCGLIPGHSSEQDLLDAKVSHRHTIVQCYERNAPQLKDIYTPSELRQDLDKILGDSVRAYRRNVVENPLRSATENVELLILALACSRWIQDYYAHAVQAYGDVVEMTIPDTLFQRRVTSLLESPEDAKAAAEALRAAIDQATALKREEIKQKKAAERARKAEEQRRRDEERQQQAKLRRENSRRHAEGHYKTLLNKLQDIANDRSAVEQGSRQAHEKQFLLKEIAEAEAVVLESMEQLVAEFPELQSQNEQESSSENTVDV